MPNGIAYFSMEFGVAEVLPNYSGGLGILAGDHLKSASDLGLPLIAVGLYYRSGYFRQSLTADGWQQENYPSLDPQGLPLRLLTDSARRRRCWSSWPCPSPRSSGPGCGSPRSAGFRCCCSIPTSRRTSTICAVSPTGCTAATRSTGSSRRSWPASAGCGRSARSPRSRACPTPEVFHMNEGHAGFLGVERIRELIEADGLDFDTALTVVRSSTVFTTHTPVPAGIDRFPVEMVRALFRRRRRRSRLLPGVPVDRILAFGAEDDPTKFNMAHMGLRLAQRANGVSLLHGRVSRRDVQRAVAGLRPGGGADRLDHQRRARARPGRRRSGWSWAASCAGVHRGAARAAGVGAAAGGRPRPHVVDPLAAAGHAGRRRPGAAAPLMAGAWCLGGRTRLDCNGFRSRRADHRVRPPGSDLQAPDADAARSGAAGGSCCSTRSGRSS